MGMMSRKARAKVIDIGKARIEERDSGKARKALETRTTETHTRSGIISMALGRHEATGDKMGIFAPVQLKSRMATALQLCMQHDVVE